MLRPYRSFLGWSCFVLLLAVAAWSSTFSPSYQKCIADNAEYSSDDKSADLFKAVRSRPHIPFFLLCEGRFIDENNGTLTILATVAIAWFTLTLKQTTARLWEAGERQHAITNRAFVFLEGFDYDIGQPPKDMFAPAKDRRQMIRLIVKPRWKNSGNTPTKNMTIQVHFTSDGEPYDWTYIREPEPFFLGPQAAAFSSFRELPRGSADDLASGRNHGETNIFIWGRAEYEDVVLPGSRHFTEWCYRICLGAPDGDILRADFVQWGAYNRSDEDSNS